MSPRTGRPTKDPKNNQYRIRLSDREVELLEFCCEKTGLSKSDIVSEVSFCTHYRAEWNFFQA